MSEHECTPARSGAAAGVDRSGGGIGGGSGGGDGTGEGVETRKKNSNIKKKFN